MTRRHVYKTNFTAGELDPHLLGRGDLRAYENGARRLRNVVLHPTGGVSRRDGLQFLAELPGPGRLVAFEFNTEQIYLLVFTHQRLDVYQDGALIAGGLAAPWNAGDLPQIAWVQSADTLFVTHPDYQTRLITRTGAGAWSIAILSYAQFGQEVMMPHHKFAGPDVTLDASGTAPGPVVITASAAVFAPEHVGVALRLNGGYARITGLNNGQQVTAEVQVALADHEPSAVWTEEAFSNVRGWPTTVAFHQNRLVLGGSRDLPNHIWMSKTDDLLNFDPGTGLDDEAIHFELLSDQVNAVRGMLSGRHLQVFTSGGEWMVTGDPLTPTTVQLKRQTRIGSRVDRYVPPRNVDGATLFVGRSGDTVNEFLFTDLEQAYLANDLTLLAGGLVRDVTDLDYADSRRLVYAVLGDGGIAALTQYRAEKVTAWTRQDTAGEVLSLAVVGDRVYLLVDRANGHMLEVFEPGVLLDSALTGSADPPTAAWSGLDHLEGESVAVVADGRVRAPAVVDGGAVALDEPAGEVAVGLDYTHEVEPLPPLVSNAMGLGHGLKVRLIAATFRLLQTADLRVDVGDGPRPVPFRRLGGDLLDQPVAPFSGDKSVRALGWRSAGLAPLWRIEGPAPLPFTLLSVTTEMKVND